MSVAVRSVVRSQRHKSAADDPEREVRIFVPDDEDPLRLRRHAALAPESENCIDHKKLNADDDELMKLKIHSCFLHLLYARYCATA